MHRQETVRKRIWALDGTSFRFERKAQALYVNDMPARVHVLSDGRVELMTERKTVQVSGATYWEMIYDDVKPTPLHAGILLAKYDELIGQLEHLAQTRQEKEPDDG